MLVAFVALGGLVGGCAGSDDDDVGGGDAAPELDVDAQLRVGLVGASVHDVFDPLKVAPTNPSAMIALDLVSDSLTERPGGIGSSESAESAVPSIAQSLTPDAAHTVWTVEIDGARTFSDGTPITADDVVFSLERAKARGAENLAGARLDVVASVASVDPRTVEITTTGPFVQLPDLLASPLYGIVSKSAVSHDPSTTVGSGPFALASGSGSGTIATADEEGTSPRGTSVRPDEGPGARGGVMSLVRVDGPAAGGIEVGAVELRPFDDVVSSFAAFSQGELDWTLVPSGVAAPSTDVGALIEAPTDVVGWLGINAADPTYAEHRFRQAIAQAIDREAVIESAVPGGAPLEAIVAASVPGHVDDPCGDLCDVSYAPDTARALLAEVFPDGVVPTVTLDGYDDPHQRALLERVQRNLEAVGIPVQQHLEPPDEYEAFVVSGHQGVFSLGTVGIAPLQDSYVGSSFLSDSGDNTTGVRSASLDDEIRAARGDVDDARREDRYRSIERQVLAEYVQVPLYQLQVRQAVGKRVRGFETRLDGTIVLRELVVVD